MRSASTGETCDDLRKLRERMEQRGEGVKCREGEYLFILALGNLAASASMNKPTNGEKHSTIVVIKHKHSLPLQFLAQERLQERKLNMQCYDGLTYNHWL